MGFIKTFKEAFKYRLAEQKGQRMLGKSVFYMGMRRKIVKETHKDVYLRGILGPISKECFINK